MVQQTASALFAALLVGSLVGGGFALSAVSPSPPGTDVPNQTDAPPDPDNDPTAPLSAAQTELTTFEDRAAFEAYVAAGQHQAGGMGGQQVGGDAGRARPTVEEGAPQATPDAADGGDGGGESAPDRIAETNIQVASLDEPDIVKTDGRNFYYAPENRRHYVESRPDRRDAVREKDSPPVYDPARTHIIDASDPEAPDAIAHIDTSGKLLQSGDRLVVFEHDRIAGYDVSDPQNPSETWSHPLNGSLVTARERNGTLYLVTESRVGVGTPCPVEPLGAAHSVACDDIYRPSTQISVDATYTAFSVDVADGAVTDSVSFVGTSHNTVVYMSPDALYVTYTKSTDRASLIAHFLREEFDRTPAHVRDRIAEIQSYDISGESKQREIRRAVQQWLQSLPDDEREQVTKKLRKQLDTYIGNNQRNLTQTGIVRVDVSGSALGVESTGVVPGEPLNQFSMDQYDGTLRIATTIPPAGDADSVNDLYTLDATSLDRKGAVTGMGEDERVYSVRYVDDTAYVVTFRRIDPFHVVDLSDPANPEEVGELELPGFSSYLHPVDENHVLGVGEEDGEVKTVLFDVSDPSNPTIADSEKLQQDYSAVAQTHHAFLMDRKHGVFVLPAGRESVVMNYTGGELSIETTIETDEPATRARYVEDSLYLFAGDDIAVVDETTWERTTTVHLDG